MWRDQLGEVGAQTPGGGPAGEADLQFGCEVRQVGAVVGRYGAIHRRGRSGPFGYCSMSWVGLRR